MPTPESERDKRSFIARKIADMRRRLDVSGFRGFSTDELEVLVRRNSRRRPPGMAPALVEPPRGPKPLQGGAAAALEFDD
jgi:hypothetical protein